MAQFDLFRNPSSKTFPYLLDVQADVLARLSSRVVVPLIAAKRYGARPITRLNPTVAFRGTDYILMFQDLASVPTTALADKVGTLERRRPDLITAIDLLFTGV